MQWALVATIVQSINYYVQPQVDEWGNQITNGYWTILQVQPGTIVNIIVYDGVSNYTAPDGTKLEQVPDTAKIGDTGYAV